MLNSDLTLGQHRRQRKSERYYRSAEEGDVSTEPSNYDLDEDAAAFRQIEADARSAQWQALVHRLREVLD